MFTPPNHTQTPNTFFDSLPSTKSLAELKVILVVMRQTFGWHKEKDQMSLSRLQKLTGMTRQGVLNGIALALEHGHIIQEGGEAGRGHSHTYSLAVQMVNGIDHSDALNSQRDRLEIVNEIDPQKKDKENKTPLPPFSSPRFITVLGEFEQHRVETHHSLKKTGRKILYDKLSRWGEAKAIEALETAMANGWQGVFEPKANGNLYPEHPNAFRRGKVIT